MTPSWTNCWGALLAVSGAIGLGCLTPAFGLGAADYAVRVGAFASTTIVDVSRCLFIAFQIGFR